MDISQLSEAQQTALQTYTSVTDQEPLAAIHLLQRCEWNVQIAIARFFDGEPATDPLAEARAVLPPTSPRQTSNLQYDSVPAATRTSTSPRLSANNVERISSTTHGEAQHRPPFLISMIFTPLGIIYRILSTFLAPFSFLIPSFFPRLLSRLTSSQRARPSRKPLPPADNARRFIREFSEEYGPTSLPFAETGFNLALDTAKQDLRFLAVVLLSPSHDDTNVWVRETLLSNQIGDFFSSHKDEIILWGGSVQDAEAYQVADALQCTKFPFLALVCHSSETGSAGMSAVMRATGPMSASELVAKIGTAMTANQGQLNATRNQLQEQQASRNLRQEQDSAYERSLAQDRERALRRREEQEAQTKAEQEAIAKTEAKEYRRRNLEQWRQWRLQSLPDEPDAASKDATRISIRLADGERVVRRFRVDADLEELYAFVECYGIPKSISADVRQPQQYEHNYDFRLVSPMPRTVYDLEKGSIGDRIGRGANLIVEPIHDDVSDEET